MGLFTKRSKSRTPPKARPAPSAAPAPASRKSSDPKLPLSEGGRGHLALEAAVGMRHEAAMRLGPRWVEQLRDVWRIISDGAGEDEKVEITSCALP